MKKYGSAVRGVKSRMGALCPAQDTSVRVSRTKCDQSHSRIKTITVKKQRKQGLNEAASTLSVRTGTKHPNIEFVLHYSRWTCWRSFRCWCGRNCLASVLHKYCVLGTFSDAREFGEAHCVATNCLAFIFCWWSIFHSDKPHTPKDSTY